MKNPRRLPGLALIVASALTFHTGSASAQEKTFKEQLTGAWTLVSNNNVAPDGTKRQNFGPDPKGILILDGSGRFAFAIRSPDRPNFKGNNRLKGTAEENQAVVRGSNFNFGSWSVDETKKNSQPATRRKYAAQSGGSRIRSAFHAGGRRTNTHHAQPQRGRE